MRSVTPKMLFPGAWENNVHGEKGGEDQSSGQTAESRVPPRLPRRMALDLADACHLEHEAFSFFLLPHQHGLDTEPRLIPWEDGPMNHKK